MTITYDAQIYNCLYYNYYYIFERKLIKICHFNKFNIILKIHQRIDAEFEAVSQAMNALEQSIDNKASSSHSHDDRYYTEEEIDAMEFITTNDIDAICNSSLS
jgi:hypothetical protein